GRRPSRASSGQRFDHGQVEAFRVQPAPDEAKTLVEFPIGPANAVRLGRLAYRTHPIRPALRIDAKIEHTELADHDRTVLGSCPFAEHSEIRGDAFRTPGLGKGILQHEI